MLNQKEIQNLCDEALEQRVFSGYQLYAQSKSSAPLHLTGGVTSYWEGNTPITSKTYFDIGSITKAVTGLSLFVRGWEKEFWGIETSLEEKLPALSRTAYGKLKIKNLLSHSAGLLDWFPLYESKKKVLLDVFLENESKFVVAKPGETVRYSDLDLLLLGLFMKTKWPDLNQAFQEEVVKPLSLSHVRYGQISDKSSVAATEVSQVRDRLLWGEVFDENAHSLGGISVHAGLFASAEGLAPFCLEWLKARKGKSAWISQKTAEVCSKKTNLVKDSTWGLGWDTKSPDRSSAGLLFSEESFGHLGYPGCSVWIDPKNELFCIFNTNRVHPSRYDERIRKLRPLIHDAVFKAVAGK